MQTRALLETLQSLDAAGLGGCLAGWPGGWLARVLRELRDQALALLETLQSLDPAGLGGCLAGWPGGWLAKIGC